MKNYLITGGAGYIGSHTVHYLISKGVNPSNVFVFDNLTCGHQEFLPAGVNFIKGDLLNKSEINNVFLQNKIDYVIHFAAFISVAESMENPAKYFENNIIGGLNLLEAMRRGGCDKIVFSSTAAVYGNPDKLLISETQKKEPINPYGESKLMFEKILKYYTDIYNFKAVIFRYFNACGAGFGIGEAHNPETHLIPLVLRAARGVKENIVLYGTDYDTLDGACIRDYIHVLDLADAHYKAIDLLDKVDFKIDYFNLGTGEGISVKEIINIAKKITGIDFKVIEKGRRVGDPSRLVADPSKINNILSWQAKYTIEDIIKSAWNWENNSNFIHSSE